MPIKMRQFHVKINPVTPITYSPGEAISVESVNEFAQPFPRDEEMNLYRVFRVRETAPLSQWEKGSQGPQHTLKRAAMYASTSKFHETCVRVSLPADSPMPSYIHCNIVHRET